MNQITTVINQPSYIPWLGYFEQIIKADIFIFYDDVQFTKRDWRTRNYIKTQQGKHMLSIPVRLEKSYKEYKINEVKISYEENWVDKHLKTIQHAYSRSAFYSEVYPILENILHKKHVLLSELNIDIIKNICHYLNIDTNKLYFSSQLEACGDQNRRLVNICKHFNTNIYYTGAAAQNYLDSALFAKHGIEVVYQQYEHPIYPQGGEGFVSHLSVIDLLFNCGKESKEIIKGY